MNFPKSRAALATLPVMLLCTILCSLPRPAHGQNESLQIRLEKALENARAVTNVEIHYDDMLWLKGQPDQPPFTNDFTRISHITYIASAEKYRVESRTESPSTTNIVKLMQTAFDGKLFTSCDGGPLLVEKDGDVSNHELDTFCPLILPFRFITRESDDGSLSALTFTDLRSPGILNGLILPEAASSNGMFYLSFPGLPHLGVDQQWGLAIADSAPGFEPASITWSAFGGSQVTDNSQMIYTFSDYTNLGDYRFPTRMAWSCFTTPTNRPPESFLAMTGQVTAVSFKIPESIPLATFRLDESIAPRIWYGGQTKGFGVGLLLAEVGSNVVVRRIVRDSPAAAQNQLHLGDRLLSIAESNAPPVAVHAGKADLPRAIARLQGPKGTAIRLTFIPAGADDSRAQSITLVRGQESSRSASHSELANGMKAPDIAMVNLANRATEHLSDYAGKIVVLEFWATWCAPCRKNLADLQLAFAQYPQWKDNVVVLAASIDDTADIAARFIAEKGWNQTHNVWLPTPSIKSYFVGGIPYAYVIDTQGTITVSGNPPDPLNIADQVNHLLETPRPPNH